MSLINIPLIVKEYVIKMLHEASVGMKALIVDDLTMNVVSSAFTQTELLHKEVFLVEKLHVDEDKTMQHLKAVCFVRPTDENISLICSLLKANTYGEYFLFFSNVLKDTHIQALAEADEQQVVRQVQELFANFLAVDPCIFTLDLPNNHELLRWKTDKSLHPTSVVDPIVEGLAAFLLSAKRRPLVRHQRSSDVCRRVAEDISRVAYEQEIGLFDFRRHEGTSQLIILDRMDDPVTPLLSQWTYQAMVHELIGIKNNRVSVCDSSNEKQDMVISSLGDTFFKENMYANYGDLGSAIKRLVDDFQTVSRMNKQIDSIEDMQKFVESFPEFRQQSGNVSKHVALMSELSRIINENSLMGVSQVEQEVACGSDQVFAYNSIMQQLADPKVKPVECFKLVLLFALRYEGVGSRQVDEMITALSRMSMSSLYLRVIRDIVRIAGEECRTGDLFGNRNFFARASKLVGGLNGADNVYTQHQPLLVQTLENIYKGKAKESDYPYINGIRGSKDAKPQEILVFIVGGITYEEARFVAQMNDSCQGVHVILGGNTILNSTKFVDDLAKALQ